MEALRAIIMVEKCDFVGTLIDQKVEKTLAKFLFHKCFIVVEQKIVDNTRMPLLLGITYTNESTQHYNFK